MLLRAIALVTLAASAVACGPTNNSTDASDTPRVDSPTDRVTVDTNPMDVALDAADSSMDARDSAVDASEIAVGDAFEVVDSNPDESVGDVPTDEPLDGAVDAPVDVPIDTPIVPQCDATTTVRISNADFDLASGDSHAALVWVEPAGHTLRVGFVEADATVRGIQTIPGTTSPSQPRITRTTSGWAVVWWDSFTTVRFQRLDPTLAPIGSSAPVRTVPGTDYRPRISAAGDDLGIEWFASTSTGELELWITSVTAAGTIATPARITTAVSDSWLTPIGAASWGVLFSDRAGGATSAGTLVTYSTAAGLGTPVVLAPIGLTQRITWTGSNYLAASLFGLDEYVETYTASGSRTSQRHFMFATPTAASGTAAYGPLVSIFGAYAQPVCLNRPTGGTSFLDIGWFAADGSTARPEGPVIDIPDPNCAETTMASMDANHAVIGWADITVSDHDLTMRVLCP